MAQHDYSIANGSGFDIRSDVNNALAAIVSDNSGAAEPSATFAYMRWFDTGTGLLKRRNAANTAWLIEAAVSGGEWIPYSAGEAAAPAWGNALAPHEGLIVQRASLSTADIDADVIWVRDSSGAARRLTNVNLTVDITTAGANGLDTGTETAFVWYYLHAIYNATLSSQAGLLSLSADNPTLPSGYTYSGLVGAIRNDGAGDLVPLHQRGREAITQRNTPLNAGTATTYTAVSLGNAVPAIATGARGYLTVDRTAGSAAVDLYAAAEGTGTAASLGEERASLASGVTGFASAPWDLTLKTAQQILYRVAGTSARGSITCSQWRY